MAHSNERIQILVHKPSIFQYDEQSCVLMDPDRPTWLKTSESGRWIFDLIRRGALNLDEILARTADHYGLPVEAIEKPVRDLIEQLVQRGFADDGTGRGAETRRDAVDSLAELGLHSVWLNLLSQCNLSCSHCFQPENPGSTPLSIENARKIFGILAEKGVKTLYLSGGEPLLHPFLEAILRDARELSDWRIFLVTNAFTDDHDRIRRLSEYLDVFQISVDGIDEQTHDSLRRTGSFTKALAVFRLIRELGDDVESCLSFTPHPRNVHQIPKLFNFALDIGADSIHLTKPKIPGRFTRNGNEEMEHFLSLDFRREVYEAYDQLIRNFIQQSKGLSTYRSLKLPLIDSGYDPALNLLFEGKRTACGAGATTLFIDEAGNCYPCTALNRPEHRLGNLLEESFEEIYERRGLGTFRKRLHVDLIEDCKDCDFKYFCGGDCRALGDSIEERTPYCELIKERFHRFLTGIRAGA